MHIDDNHKIPIEISMWMLDQLLNRIDNWANKHAIHSILYEELNTLTDKQCSELQMEIKYIRTQLEILKSDIGLKARSEPVNQLIHASCILFITDNLSSIQGESLDAYGKASDELHKYIEPKIGEIILRLEKIANISIHE